MSSVSAVGRPGIEFVTVGAPVTVGYFREDGRWWAVAQEFDLLGSGDGREEALRELKEVVEDYVEAYVFEGSSEFERHCPDEDWSRTNHHERYIVVLAFVRRSRRQRGPDQWISGKDVGRLRSYRRRFVGADLAEVRGAF